MSRIFTGPVPRTLAAIRAVGLDPDTILRDGMTATTYKARATSAAGGPVRDPNDSERYLEQEALWPTPEIGAEIFAIYVDEITAPAEPIGEDDLFWSKVNAVPASGDALLWATGPGALGIVAIALAAIGAVAVCIVVSNWIGGGV